MSKTKKQYVCRECAAVSFKWSGCCENCGSWNSFEEVAQSFYLKSSGAMNSGLYLNSNSNSNCATNLSVIRLDEVPRFSTGMAQLDELFGGGLVQGSLCLIGGCPGIGKSTLLLQVCANLSEKYRVLYVSGEESNSQIKLRADRLKIESQNLFVFSEYDIQKIVSEIENLKPEVVVVDSIQTVSCAQVQSACGSVVQVKHCAYILQQIAKCNNIAIVVVGHVNKEGAIAGPKVLEHVVDVVLAFEGELNFSRRILRVKKNRFGPANEIAVFEMKSEGLVFVSDPSKELLCERPKGVCGSCVCCLVEGSRPIFTEIQSIVAKSAFLNARRMSNGVDYGKLALAIAVLEKRMGLSFKNFDCYVNVVGSIKLENDSGCDLALLLSLISSLKNVAIDDDVVAFGEVGLAGEVRSAAGFEKAVLEAQKLGFKKFLLPRSCQKKLQRTGLDVKIVAVSSVAEAARFCFG